MKVTGTRIRREEIEFFLRLHGLWQGIIHLPRPRPRPRPPPPPFDIDTMEPIEPIEPPWQAIKEWIPDDEPNLNWFNQERPTCDSEPDQFDQSPDWRPEEIPLGDGRTLILEDS
ncbi:MAG: hypothetical protein P1U82_27530 [Verrucomicrobiales bacterium]|nr:hypothetical protein [Verrucomicrobiales bacterium]